MKLFLFILTLLVAALVSNTYAANDHILYGQNVTVQILGHSGKIRFFVNNNHENNTNTTTNVFTVGFHQLTELDTTGKKIHGNEHKVTFASTNFQFSDFNSSNVYQNVSAQTIEFKVALNPTGQRVSWFISQLILFKADGNITIDNKTVQVKKDSFKFNVMVSNWTFCNGDNQFGCKQQTGKYLDLEMKFQSPTKQCDHDSDNIKLSKNVKVILSKEVKVDGTTKSIDPNVDQSCSLSLKFPRFVHNIFYDPLVDIQEEAPSPTPTPTPTPHSHNKSKAGMIVGIVFGVLAATVVIGGAILYTKRKESDDLTPLLPTSSEM